MGRAPYWAAVRLCFVAERHWGAIDGDATHRGVDYFDLTFDRFLNAIYWWVIQRVKDPDAYDAELDEPPPEPGAPRRVTAKDLEQDASSFMAFARAFGISPPKPKAAPDGDSDVTSPASM